MDLENTVWKLLHDLSKKRGISEVSINGQKKYSLSVMEN